MRAVRQRLLSGMLAVLFLAAGPHAARAQEGTTIPREYRGTQEAIARGILDGNLIETNYRNHGEFARWNDIPWGVWPRSIGGRHVDGIGVVVAGLVRGHRAKYAGPPYNYFAAGTNDTLLNPVAINYRDAGKKLGPNGQLWGWQPLPGFLNPLRRSQVTAQREPTPALSDDPTSWPAFWPDKLGEQDAGWAGSWNGMFGKGVFSADLESFYVIDDLTDAEYTIDPLRKRPFSNFGVYYPDPSDSTMAGMGLQVNVRILQWANVLAEDAMFMIYRITNVGQTNFGECIDVGRMLVNAPFSPECGELAKTGLYFSEFVDYGLGEEEGDESAAFNPQLDIAYGWDHDGVGNRPTGGTYELGYTGFAFLESPANAFDGLDNDEDGIIDESRFEGPGMLVQGQDAILAHAQSVYDVVNFERFYGPITERPAYRAGVWWTGDENLDWLGYEDSNGNGRLDQGEFVNDDFGRDGLGPYDLGYPGPDDGEGDGKPTIREPNFDELDVDESDQIGLTGFHLSARPFYESGDNLRDDTWMWEHIRDSQFELGHKPEEQVADVEPFLTFSSGPVTLAPNKTDFFSTAWLFGENEQDFFKNRQTVQRIYNADYRFAQPPIVPTLKSQAGDGYVILSWDTLSLASYDRFTQEFDFEGYRLYKGTDPLLSDARLVTNIRGVATFYKPLAQWDVKDGVRGGVPVMENQALFDLGEDTGLEFSFIDRDVTNGKTYYYALVAYDKGFIPGSGSANPNAAPIDPQENTFNISVDQGGNVRGFTQNVAIVTPRSRAAGFVESSANEDLSKVSGGIGTGSMAVTVVNNDNLVPGAVYRVEFFDSTKTLQDMYETTGYQLRNVTTNTVLIPRSPLAETTPAMEGFILNIANDQNSLNLAETGWKGSDGNGGVEYSRDPRDLLGYTTNWRVEVRADDSPRYYASPFEYEIRFADSLYTTPNRPRGFLAGKQIPMWCRNVTKEKACELIVQDVNENGNVDFTEDAFIISDFELGIQKFRHVVRFFPIGDGNRQPTAGNTVRVGTFRPFSRQDYFQFTLREGFVDTEQAQAELDRVAVVPNPYVAAATWEPRTQITGRGPRRIQFIHLPETCTIKIYTVRGELVRTLTHEGTAGDGAEWWDLKSEDNQDIAYGVYLFLVDAPGIGQKTGKFAIVK